jgi:hypothetical protein
VLVHAAAAGTDGSRHMQAFAVLRPARSVAFGRVHGGASCSHWEPIWPGRAAPPGVSADCVRGARTRQRPCLRQPCANRRLRLHPGVAPRAAPMHHPHRQRARPWNQFGPRTRPLVPRASSIRPCWTPRKDALERDASEPPRFRRETEWVYQFLARCHSARQLDRAARLPEAHRPRRPIARAFHERVDLLGHESPLAYTIGRRGLVCSDRCRADLAIGRELGRMRQGATRAREMRSHQVCLLPPGRRIRPCASGLAPGPALREEQSTLLPELEGRTPTSAAGVPR